jgi:integrase
MFRDHRELPRTDPIDTAAAKAAEIGTRPAARQAQRVEGLDVPIISPGSIANHTIGTLSVLALLGLVRNDYTVRNLRSRGTVGYPLRHVARALGSRKASEVDEGLLGEYVIERRREGAAESSIRTELSLLHRGYVLAVRNRVIRQQDIPAFPTITSDRLKVRRGFLREDQVRAIQARLDGDTSDIVGFLFASAWRVGEARGLTWDCVEEDAIYLPTSKSGHGRVIPIAGEVAEIIERRRQRALGPYVFHRNGVKMGDFRQQWNRAAREAGLTGRIVHDLRRSAMKRMLEAGADLKTAMQWSGHRTMHTALRYHIVDLSRMRDVAELVQKRPPVRAPRSQVPARQQQRWERG